MSQIVGQFHVEWPIQFEYNFMHRLHETIFAEFWSIYQPDKCCSVRKACVITYAIFLAPKVLYSSM